MKFVFAVAISIAAVPAFAQTAPTPTPTAAPTPGMATTPTATKFNLDTPIETIAADPAGKAVLDKDLPGLTAHAMYDSFKSMSLSALAPMSGGAISDEALAKAGTDLAAIK